MENVKEELRCRKLNLDSYTKYAEGVLSKATPSCVASIAQELNSKAEELKHLRAINVDNEFKVSFIPSDLQCFTTSDKNIIGKITILSKCSNVLNIVVHCKLTWCQAFGVWSDLKPCCILYY